MDGIDEFQRQAFEVLTSPRLAQALVAGAGREAAVVRLFFLQRHGDLLDPESRDAAQQFHAGLERLVAEGKADHSVRPGSAAVWAAVWLGVVSLALDRLSSREWDEKDAGVGLVLDGAWNAIGVGLSDPKGLPDGRGRTVGP